MFERAPERTPANQPLAGDHLARLTEDACRVASEEGRVESGCTVLRPTLREATRAVLVRSGLDDATARAQLDSGEWTDDRLAASVLSREVAPPPVPLRKRLRRWLFPETVVRERIARAVDALVETADAGLPTVVGQDAPRPVPVAPPTLEDRHRYPDGSIGRGSPEVRHGRTEPEARPGRTDPGAPAGRGDFDARHEQAAPEAPSEPGGSEAPSRRGGPRAPPGRRHPEDRRPAVDPGQEDEPGRHGPGEPTGTHGRTQDPARDDRRLSGQGRTGRGGPDREEADQGRTDRRRDGAGEWADEPDSEEHWDRQTDRTAGQEDGV